MSPSFTKLYLRSTGILTSFPFLLSENKFPTQSTRLDLQLGPTNSKRNTLLLKPFSTQIIKISVQNPYTTQAQGFESHLINCYYNQDLHHPLFTNSFSDILVQRGRANLLLFPKEKRCIQCQDGFNFIHFRNYLIRQVSCYTFFK